MTLCPYPIGTQCHRPRKNENAYTRTVIDLSVMEVLRYTSH